MMKQCIILLIAVTIAIAHDTQAETEQCYAKEKVLRAIKNEAAQDDDLSRLGNQELSVDSYMKQRQHLIEKDKSTYFTFDVPTLTDKELKVEEALFNFRKEVVDGDDTPLKLDFYESKKIVEKSKIYNVMKSLPKGAHLHLHTTGAFPIELLMKFTYEDYVYYNSKENKLMTAPNGISEPGYEKCNTLRKNWSHEGTFDEFLRGKILLTADDIKSKNSNMIWDKFQYKFMLTDGLVNYDEFFRQGVLDMCLHAIKEKVFIVEFRHIAGMIFDENNKFITLDQEFAIYQSVLDEVRKVEPSFEMRVILSALKILGHQSVIDQLNNYVYAKKHFKIASGFDMVNEEDTTPPVLEFLDELQKAREEIDDFSFLLHSGESTSRYNENLYDAILLGTRRIGHGLAIDLHPHLVELVRERDVGIEICPISNNVLAYVLDYRWHPARHLMTKGVAVTINSDDPGFWDYQGLSLDFTYAFLAWQLDLKDLKQLAINSVKHSSVNEEQVKPALKHFYQEWQKFIDSFNDIHLASE